MIMDNIVIFYNEDISNKLEGITRFMINQTEYSPGDGINYLLKFIANQTGWPYATLRIFKGVNNRFYIAPDPIQINQTLSIVKKSEIIDFYSKLNKNIRYINESQNTEKKEG